ncbi:uncharacterized protein LOC135095922 [Scylla paramamosain]|uniref:uncharacterized protein LOC135095922 n=1 Tax=Scylla paramamosain TaxID=85552 RepID=UPI003082AD35
MAASSSTEVGPEDMFRPIGDEYFTFITKCQDPKACTVLLRGPSKDILNEVERNLQDALGVARNLAQEPRLVPGGGSVDMAVSNFLQQKAKGVSEVRQWPYSALAQALKSCLEMLLNCLNMPLNSLNCLEMPLKFPELMESFGYHTEWGEGAMGMPEGGAVKEGGLEMKEM